MLKLLPLLFLFACAATATKVYTSDGREGFSLDCSGGGKTWGSCLEKAGELCGARGYDVMDRSDSTNAAFMMNRGYAYGGVMQSRTMVVRCK